ncbi:sigma-70 family RNA polymerase sigma factor [Sphingomonas sp. R647]|uniref:RNA polymerase sigma factor n=1 Tax=Sphingomonas sp. R647 TaxID=2875233 RepID=UPI001CD1EF43|nr:sigma-70 family RNA polymerase sigma factor [Sphingomonas sp. R647]MCA1196494.1 sigma-70 family RNA polymerase sigma factor [Sphingomonas sp. R647]
MRARDARGSPHSVDPGDSGVLPAGQGILGDAERHGLDLLYRAQRPSLLALFMRGRKDAGDAEDLAQETFLRFARARTASGPVEQPGSYLRQIGRNLIRDRARAPATRLVTVDSEVTDHAVSDADELCRLEARDSLRRIEAAMLQLKPKTREIFLAHRLDGMSYAQIAQATGLSVKGVEKQMTRAIAQIRRAMDRDA